MFIQQNDIVRAATFTAHYEDLPPGLYSVGYGQMTGFFLTKKEPFSLPEKIYGPVNRFPDRILSTYDKLNKGMSVLLSGPKGTGKTVDAKLTCNASNKPVILITSNFTGPGFQTFIDEIKTPSIFFIDEFEKIYAEEEEKNFFLSIMDGVSKSRHLYIVTSNSEDIGEFFDSRPGRVRYHKHYEHLDDEFIIEIIKDKLANKANQQTVIDYVMGLSEISIDSLTCIIEECNLYNEVPSDFMSFFNVKDAKIGYYSVMTTIKGAAPIKGLKGKALKDAVNAVNYYNDYDEKLECFDKCCELVDIEYSAEWATPFRDEDGSDGTTVLGCYLYTEEAKQKYFKVYKNQVESFTKNRKGFELVTKDGRVFVGKANKTRRGVL